MRFLFESILHGSTSRRYDSICRSFKSTFPDWSQKKTIKKPAPAPTIATTGFDSTCKSSGMLIRSSFSRSDFRATRTTCPSTTSTLYAEREIFEKVIFSLFSNLFRFTRQMSVSRMLFDVARIHTETSSMSKATQSIIDQNS